MAFIQTPIFRPGQNVTFKQKVDSEVEYKGTVQSSKRDMDFFTYYVKLYAKKDPVQGWVVIPTEIRPVSDFQLSEA